MHSTFLQGVALTQSRIHLRHVVNISKDIFPLPFDDVNLMRGTLIENLVKQYMANIKSSIVGKWKSIIFNSISTHVKIFYPDLDNRQNKKLKANIYKQKDR